MRRTRNPDARLRVPCVDSTGAGDAFRGGFIAALLQHGPEDVEVLLRMANAVAALKCRTAGAQEGLPHAAELEMLLAEDKRGTACLLRTAFLDERAGNAGCFGLGRLPIGPVIGGTSREWTHYVPVPESVHHVVFTTSLASAGRSNRGRDGLDRSGCRRRPADPC